MTLLQDLRPLRVLGEHRRRLTWRWLALGLSVGIAMAASIGLPIYADHYQPLEQGNYSGRGIDSGLMELNDGLQATRWVVADPGKPAHFLLSLANRGRHAVKVLSIGDPFDEANDYFRMGVTHMDDPRSRCCMDGPSLPFAPFELKPGQQRLLRIAVTTQACEANEADGQSIASMIPVTYRFWGKNNDTWVPLALPVVRACPATGIRPHIDPPAVTGDSRLVPSGYDFAVPRDWTEKPLENLGGPASFASWTSPDGKGKVEYEVNGGMTGVLYDQHGQPTAAGARAATGCELKAFITIVKGWAYEYTCRATATTRGVLRSGVLRVKPSPEGFERMEITSADKALVSEFLKSVKA